MFFSAITWTTLFSGTSASSVMSTHSLCSSSLNWTMISQSTSLSRTSLNSWWTFSVREVCCFVPLQHWKQCVFFAFQDMLAPFFSYHGDHVPLNMYMYSEYIKMELHMYYMSFGQIPHFRVEKFGKWCTKPHPVPGGAKVGHFIDTRITHPNSCLARFIVLRETSNCRSFFFSLSSNIRVVSSLFSDNKLSIRRSSHQIAFWKASNMVYQLRSWYSGTWRLVSTCTGSLRISWYLPPQGDAVSLGSWAYSASW